MDFKPGDRVRLKDTVTDANLHRISLGEVSQAYRRGPLLVRPHSKGSTWYSRRVGLSCNDVSVTRSGSTAQDEPWAWIPADWLELDQPHPLDP